ncbi:MAG: S9 family peptidase [Calditrichales bacterium]|nr:MAG: S9 family peptidase [Calditrichales bacterium]
MNNQTVIYRTGEGVWATFSTVSKNGGERKVIFDSKKEKVILGEPSKSADNTKMVMTGSSPQMPGEVFFWQPGKKPMRKTDVNPDLKNTLLGEQKIIQYSARDGQVIEGVLILPVAYKKGDKYPLIVYVHGGPEHHHYNEWLSSYSTPGQVMAGKGYAVLYPNYRASTGYGVAFAMAGYGDPAGKEFDDIADGIDFLVNEGIADKDRVGLAGGSYGGYASAWFASYYTKYVRAVCMFVGISDLISKQGTTDIAYEDLYVHAGKKLEEMWDISLQRSPIYWAHQSKTATLIYGGAADTRVHPSQSLEFYYRLKMNDHPAVRLVQYPGEGHGNRNQPGRIDVLYRQVGWMDWYVYDKKPLDGPMPPLDISENYGLNQD